MTQLAEDKVGVPDLTLLQALDEKALNENLKLRFQNSKVYSSIGDVVVSINPYQKYDIYGPQYIELYKGKYMYEMPPHIYSIADNAFRNMRGRSVDQCVIISGESGAGKTEASKLIMKYIAAVAESSQDVDKIKEQLLNSNPCLEALGNAKTTRNDNSSRFGKYMDLQFDFKGDPVGGYVTTYLLEKARIIRQNAGERSFHIFYQLIKGADAELLSRLNLTRNALDYRYLSNSKVQTVDGIDDKAEFDTVRSSMKAIGIDEEDEEILYEIVAAVLHLGNIDFADQEDKSQGCVVANEKSALSLQNAASLLGVTSDALLAALTTKTVKDMSKQKDHTDMTVALNADKASYTRDAMAKGLYERFFNWFIRLLNSKINYETRERKNVIGVLDIYGFEVFTKNGFEQFCINYTNERLQQVFIQLTLKSEQEEYASEGITWNHIEYFNNEVICSLIEAKPKGILSLLDEECLRPGEVSDKTFLAKLNQNVIKHAHFDSKEKSYKTDHSLTEDVFRLQHYAGPVTYNVEGFLDKNTDLLSKNVLHTLNDSSKHQIRSVFPESKTDSDLKRPETLGSQFRTSISQLMENLLSKNPHYIRCVKPNLEKKAGVYDEELVLHQCRYLGLLENIRVRRAGFCYRQNFEKFVDRYKMLSKNTWPHLKGTPAENAASIMTSVGFAKPEFEIGKTKIFIKNPSTVFALEEKRENMKHTVASKIRANYLAYIYRKKYLRMKQAAIKLQSVIRMYPQKKIHKSNIKKIRIVTKIAKGFVQRKRYRLMLARQPSKAVPIIRRFWIRRLRLKFLQEAKESMIKAGRRWHKIQWPEASEELKATSGLLLSMYRKVMAKKYRDNTKRAAPILSRFFLRCLRKNYLQNTLKSAVMQAKNWRHIQWPTKASACVKDVLQPMKIVYHRFMAKRYRKGLSPARKNMLELKLIASETFKGKKANYETSVPVQFKGVHFDLTSGSSAAKWNKINSNNEQVVFAAMADKYHRHALKKAVPRLIVLTDKTVYILDGKSLALKEYYPISNVTQVSTTNLADGFIGLHETDSKKGDCLYQFHSSVIAIEFASRVQYLTKKSINCSAQISLNAGKKTAIIKFSQDKSLPQTAITVTKDGASIIIAQDA